MADEIKVKPFVSLLKGNLSLKLSPGTISIDQTGAGYYHNVSSIATSEENIATFGDVATDRGDGGHRLADESRLVGCQAVGPPALRDRSHRLAELLRVVAGEHG